MDQQKKWNWKEELLDWAKLIVIALILVYLIRTFLLGNYIVDGSSMEPNYYDGQRIIVNKILYTFREPKRGEVIVLHAPDGREFIKRVIGLPGEKVMVDKDTVYINGEPLDEPYIAEEIEKAKSEGRVYNPYVYHETVVPEDSVFVLGDNRPLSSDSRNQAVGFIPFDKVVGRAEIIYWPIKDFAWQKY